MILISCYSNIIFHFFIVLCLERNKKIKIENQRRYTNLFKARKTVDYLNAYLIQSLFWTQDFIICVLFCCCHLMQHHFFLSLPAQEHWTSTFKLKTIKINFTMKTNNTFEKWITNRQECFFSFVVHTKLRKTKIKSICDNWNLFTIFIIPQMVAVFLYYSFQVKKKKLNENIKQTKTKKNKQNGKNWIKYISIFNEKWNFL